MCRRQLGRLKLYMSVCLSVCLFVLLCLSVYLFVNLYLFISSGRRGLSSSARQTEAVHAQSLGAQPEDHLRDPQLRQTATSGSQGHAGHLQTAGGAQEESRREFFSLSIPVPYQAVLVLFVGILCDLGQFNAIMSQFNPIINQSGVIWAI